MTKYLGFQYSVMLTQSTVSVNNKHGIFRGRSCCVLIKVLKQEQLYGANSPDLNPVDYQIWGRLQERVYRSRNHDVDQLN